MKSKLAVLFIIISCNIYAQNNAIKGVVFGIPTFLSFHSISTISYEHSKQSSDGEYYKSHNYNFGTTVGFRKFTKSMKFFWDFGLGIAYSYSTFYDVEINHYWNNSPTIYYKKKRVYVDTKINRKFWMGTMEKA